MPANKLLKLYYFNELKVYEKSREPTPSYQVVKSWGFSLVKK